MPSQQGEIIENANKKYILYFLKKFDISRVDSYLGNLMTA